MEPPLLAAYAEKLPKLQAEEALHWSAIASYPHLTEDGRDRLYHGWMSRAGWLGKRYDTNGLLILETFEETLAWLATQGLVA